MPYFADVDGNDDIQDAAAVSDEADTDDGFRDEEDQDEESVSEEWRVHPAVITWIEKKLKVSRLSPNLERFVREELADEYSLMEHPDRMAGIDQEKLIRDVRVARLFERMSAAAPAADEEPAAGTVQQQQQRKRTMPDLPVRGRKKEAEEEVFLLPLKPVERDAAEAIRAHLSVLLLELTKVRQFRRDVLGDSESILTPEQTDAFIRSPAVRILSRADWKAAGVTWKQEQVQERHGFTSHVVSDDSRVLDARQAMRRRQGADVSLVWRPSLPQDAVNYRCRRVGVQVEETASGKTQVLEKEWMRTLDEEPLWIPFLPADLKDTEVESKVAGSDDTFPQMFPYSVAQELAHLGEWLVSVLPAWNWEPWQMSLFILTGELEPAVQPMKVQRPPSPLLVSRAAINDPGKLWALQQERLTSGRGQGAAQSRLRDSAAAAPLLREVIRITAEPWVSAETIARCWMEAQRQTLGTKRLHRFPSPGILKMLPLVTKAFGHPQPDRKQQQQGSGKKRKLSLRRVLQEQQQVNQRQAEQHQQAPYLGDYSSFMKAYKSACRALNLPWDIGGRI